MIFGLPPNLCCIMRQFEQYKHLQKSKFQDKGGEETDKGEENILENSDGDRTIVEIRMKDISI